MYFGGGLAAPDAEQPGAEHESAGICKADLPQLQNH
jgi:hypothetical protein